ncbi:MAG TPA: class I SAM-dependent methyltransferase [Usitatibacter sp.]|nr:class I SAM-dependent methyltransferase [Usitatibacter sp.]
MIAVFDPAFALARRGAREVLEATLVLDAPIAFLPRFLATLRTADGAVFESAWQGHPRIEWLPRGRYRVELALPGALGARDFTATIRVVHRHAMADAAGGQFEGRYRSQGQDAGPEEPMRWTLESVPPTQPVASLGWNRGHEDWFWRHFDHAATTTLSYLLGDHPSLRGRILDIGCGDGITDLGIALRTRCEKLVGIDPFKGFERLPQILRDNRLAEELVPPNLEFRAEDANFLPFPDDSFDVIVSWGSIEHIAGGYLQALREAKRVLRDGGLIMVHPGLYYSNIGHHLGEFSSEPFFHLKKSREEIRQMVLSTPPRYIDRSGEFATNEQYWQWFTELNPITVTRFEQEMRALEFRPWRVAIRTQDLVEYTPEIEHYPMQDLATGELYSSWINRKRQRPQ